MMMNTKLCGMWFLLLVAALPGCRHTPELVKAEVYPVCCTEAIPASNRINLEQLKDVPVPEIVEFGGLKYVNDAGKEVIITTWRDFVRYRQAGYRDADNSVNVMSGWFWRTRGHIPFLEAAITARQSFVRGLRPAGIWSGCCHWTSRRCWGKNPTRLPTPSNGTNRGW